MGAVGKDTCAVAAVLQAQHTPHTIPEHCPNRSLYRRIRPYFAVHSRDFSCDFPSPSIAKPSYISHGAPTKQPEGGRVSHIDSGVCCSSPNCFCIDMNLLAPPSPSLERSINHDMLPGDSTCKNAGLKSATFPCNAWLRSPKKKRSHVPRPRLSPAERSSPLGCRHIFLVGKMGLKSAP